MNQFDLYEFIGIITPGTVLVVGIAAFYPPASGWLVATNLSVGDFGVLVLLAFVAGHLCQGLGNILEKVWWLAWGGMPTDWAQRRHRNLLSDQQTNLLVACFRQRSGSESGEVLDENARREWKGFVSEVYASVSRSGDVRRVDTFNRNYGMLRGVAAALLAVLVFSITTSGVSHPQIQIVVALAALMAIYRMHRFGTYYARELFLQYLTLQHNMPVSANDSSSSTKEHQHHDV